jgi:SPP1 gp7 family putative phage head morphogenesis protein
LKNSKEVQDFVESLYYDMEKQLNDTYRQKRESRDELLKAIALILLSYTIVNDVISLSKSDYDKEYILLYKLIKRLTKGDIKQIQGNTVNILKNTVKNTFDFYSYNSNLKEVEKIINQNFKGKHFSKRVWDNEHEVAKKLTQQCQDFLKGKINVNQIAKEIKNTYNTSAYNSKRLVTTEVSRCHIGAFERFCKETGVKKLKYNAILDMKACDDCKEYDGKVYEFGKQPSLPLHPSCRCYFDIVE